MINSIISLKAFLFVHGTTTIGTTRISRSVRNNRSVVWITHTNDPDTKCEYVETLRKIHPMLTFGNLCLLGRCKYENGDVRKEYSVVFEIKR